ncbi:MAG: tyrosine-type recombinase/integrase [Sandaracinaceae bacterium]|nr:tyrosine-type recombinase/integrase [Sandaracinaceae bacterium]
MHEPGTTLRAFGERWLRTKEAERLRSVADLRSRWRCHVLEADFVDRPLVEIRRADVRAFLRSRLARSGRRARRVSGGRGTSDTGRPLSRRTVMHIAGVLRSALADAVEEELIPVNPAERVRIALPAEVTDVWTYLSAGEIDRIWKSEELPEELRTIYLTLLYTGLRKGEAWALCWSDVVLAGDRPHLVVRRSYAGPPKSGRVGHVPLLPVARELLRSWRRATGDSELVFPLRTTRRFGAMRSRSDTAGWADYWARGAKRPGWRARLGIERRVRLHDLRHTAASHLLMGTWGRRWSLAEVRDFLRHASVQETERYAHLAPGSIFDAARDTPGWPRGRKR